MRVVRGEGRWGKSGGESVLQGVVGGGRRGVERSMGDKRGEG